MATTEEEMSMGKETTRETPAARKRRQGKLFRYWEYVPVGCPVVVTKDDGTTVDTWTRSAPDLLGGHTAVIWLEGISGAYALERVKLRAPTPTKDPR